MNTPNTDCVGNADATLQTQGYTFCREVFSRHPLEDYQTLYPLPEDSILVIAAGVLIL